MKIRILAIFTALLLVTFASFPASSATAGERSFVIIVHPDNPAESVTKDKVSLLFLKKVTKWGEGDFKEQVKPVDQASDSPIRDEFSKLIHGRSTASIKNYWQRQIFSGRHVPPDELASDKAVAEFVKSNRGAIGYVSPKADLEGVKELPLSEDKED